MPWKECSAVEERLRFVARLLDGEAMTDPSREFGISRKTGYKIFDRYKEHGLEALCDRSRRPIRYANQLPGQVESLIVSLKRDKPHWGAARSGSSSCAGYPATCACPPKAPSMPCSIVTASLDPWANDAPAQQARPCHRPSHPTICGARVSSSSATADTVTDARGRSWWQDAPACPTILGPRPMPVDAGRDRGPASKGGPTQPGVREIVSHPQGHRVRYPSRRIARLSKSDPATFRFRRAQYTRPIPA
jgi:hypothetical protein